MRSYGKVKTYMFKKAASYKERQTRPATEWDIRLDVTEQFTIDHIINNAKALKDTVQYILISGIEQPDDPQILKQAHSKWKNAVGGSLQDHVHVALVLYTPATRQDVLRMLRGTRKCGDEYCTPRNSKFTYAGWIIHHAKEESKKFCEPGIRYECGTPPFDPITTETALSVDRMLKKYGTPSTQERFKAYTNLLKKEKIHERMEKAMMALEDEDA